MPYRSTRKHRDPYFAPADAKQRLQEAVQLLSTLRDMPLHEKTKKKMLNHAIWLVVESTGNFYSKFRSAGVLAALDVPIQRDHIYPRKQLVREVLANEIDLAEIVQRAQCCIVTKDEHDRLSKISTTAQGRERYRLAEVEIHDMATYVYVSGG
jgi:hypothetical protein